MNKDNSTKPIYIAAMIGMVGVLCAALIGILPDLLDKVPKASETPAVGTITVKPTETTSTAISLTDTTPTPTVLVETTFPGTSTPTLPASNGLPSGYFLYDDFTVENSIAEKWQVDDSKRICSLIPRSGSLFFDCRNRTKNDLSAAMQPTRLFAILNGVAAQVTVTEAGGPFQLTTGWKCISSTTERAFHLALGINQVTASEYYPQEAWREQPLGQIAVSAGQPHLLQIETTSSGVEFLVDGKTIPLIVTPDFPSCLSIDNWGFSYFVWKDNNTIQGQIDWAGFKP